MVFLKKRKSVRKERDFTVSDGTMEHGEYDAGDYAEFISNGMTNNEKVEAVEYFETFLNEQ